MLKIQEFMSCFDTIEEANVYLKNKLRLDIETNNIHNYEGNSKIYIYNKSRYSDIDNPLVREANGLMIDESRALVSKCHDHHYKVKNIGDLPNGFKLCGSSVEEMTTGIIITIFNYKGVWTIATKNSINDFDYSIDVRRAIGNGASSWWSSGFDENKNYIYIFDFISKEYENVWPISILKLYLLAIIDIDTGKELDSCKVDSISAKLKFQRPVRKIIAGKRTLKVFIADTRIPSRGVIVSNNGVRVKLLNSLYYSLKTASEAGEDISAIHVARIFLACKNDIELAIISQSFPKYSDLLKLFGEVVQKVWSDLMIIWNSIQQFNKDPAKFAKAVPPYALSHLLFMYRDKKIKTFKEGVSKISPYKLVNITKDKYEKELEINTRHLKIECAHENKVISD